MNTADASSPRVAALLIELERVANGDNPLLAAHAFLALLREAIVGQRERLDSGTLGRIEGAARAAMVPLADALRHRLSPDRTAFGLAASLWLLRAAHRSTGELVDRRAVETHLDASNWLSAEIDAELCRIRVAEGGDHLFKAAVFSREFECAVPVGLPH